MSVRSSQSLSVYFCLFLFVCLMLFLILFLSVCLSVCVCLSVYVSVCLCLSVYVYVYVSVCLCLCLSVCLSLCLSLQSLRLAHPSTFSVVKKHTETRKASWSVLRGLVSRSQCFGTAAWFSGSRDKSQQKMCMIFRFQFLFRLSFYLLT